MIRVLSIFGTRPEAVKMAPVVLALAEHRDEIESVICVTAQHREMLDQVLSLFQITPDFDLNLMSENQSPGSVTSVAVGAIGDVIASVRPGLVLVQGDTTTAMVAALAAFYAQVPVGHVEAGLRTGSRYRPFPEEMNRRLLSVLSTYHFAPTDRAAEALRREGISPDRIFVTGNPGIDALQLIAKRRPTPATASCIERLGLNGNGADHHHLVLVTAHRRENWGGPLENVCSALSTLIERNADMVLVFPVHRNPSVRETIFARLAERDRIHLLDPVSYETLVHLMSLADVVLTDSGGIQEEAPALGKPVLVLRDETERPDGVELGNAKLVGTKSAVIIAETERLFRDREAYNRMARPAWPYGDGRSAERIIGIVRQLSRDVHDAAHVARV